MSISEFLRWQAFDKIFPVGYADLHVARILHTLASIYSKKGHTPKLTDFLIGELPESAPDPEELEARLDMWAAAHGAAHSAAHGGTTDED